MLFQKIYIVKRAYVKTFFTYLTIVPEIQVVVTLLCGDGLFGEVLDQLFRKRGVTDEDVTLSSEHGVRSSTS